MFDLLKMGWDFSILVFVGSILVLLTMLVIPWRRKGAIRRILRRKRLYIVWIVVLVSGLMVIFLGVANIVSSLQKSRGMQPHSSHPTSALMASVF